MWDIPHKEGKICSTIFLFIHWKSKDVRPEEGSYILLKTIDENGLVLSEPGAYENEMFIYFYSEDDWGEVNDDILLGWAYYPYDKRGEKT